jgi:hypothetical protein
MPVVLNLTARGRRRAGARMARPARASAAGKVIQAPGRAAGWLVAACAAWGRPNNR